MEIIKVKPNMVFMLETKTSLPERQTEELVERWNKLFPNNELIIVVKDTIKILEIE